MFQYFVVYGIPVCMFVCLWDTWYNDVNIKISCPLMGTLEASCHIWVYEICPYHTHFAVGEMKHVACG